MGEHEQEQTAEEREQARLDKSAAENEAVRRAEHPEEFAHEDQPTTDDDEARTVAPVTPAHRTGPNETERHERASDLTTLARLEDAVHDLRRKLFGEPSL